MQKRIYSLLIALTLTISLTACGSSASDSKANTQPQKRGTPDAAKTETDDEQLNIDSDIESEIESDIISEVSEISDDNVYQLGDIWTVDGQWSLAITRVTKTEDRNEYSDLDPAVVYLVDYTYSNDGYEDTIFDGLFMAIDNKIIDSDNEMGYSYPGHISKYSEETPVGATCEAQACIGLDHDGPFKLLISTFDGNDDYQEAVFLIDPDASPVNLELKSSGSNKETGLKLGETWTVDGQWSLTFTGITETDERNEFADFEPEAVYILDYTYENLGYEDDVMEGLYFSFFDGIVDAEGSMGYDYPVGVDRYPQETPVGATCKAQCAIGVDHAGTIKINVTQYDGNKAKQKQLFELEVN